MSIDGKLLARAKTRLDQRRREHEEAFSRRREAVYRRDPALRALDQRIKENMFRSLAAVAGEGGGQETLDAIREENMSLREQRGMELIRMGLPVDYLTERYMCPDCRDTGYKGTELCHCLMSIYRDEQRRELSELLKLGEETFDTFDLSLYSDRPDPVTGVAPRDFMQTNYDYCVHYARSFSPGRSDNLFFQGGTGLGKTFLSTCIAKVVSERGFSVVYDTAVSVFSKYEAIKFDRSDPDAHRDVKRLESCDLLIVDDLGTEFATAFVTSALYTLINSRLTGKRTTVISSNLAVSDLEARYSPAIMSRLLGGYRTVRFVGSDIRRLKNNLNG